MSDSDTSFNAIDHIDDILSLLGLAVIADKRVFSAEIYAFMKVAEDLKSYCFPDLSLTREHMLDWFEGNRTMLEVQLESADFDIWFVNLLERLKNLEPKAELIQLIHDISCSDEELHVSEKALMMLISKSWRIDVPKFNLELAS